MCERDNYAALTFGDGNLPGLVGTDREVAHDGDISLEEGILFDNQGSVHRQVLWIECDGCRRVARRQGREQRWILCDRLAELGLEVELLPDAVHRSIRESLVQTANHGITGLQPVSFKA